MFTNSNYSAKISPSMKENWMVQIFRNVNSSIMTNNDPDLALCFAPASSSEIAHFKNSGGSDLPYYPAILNRPSISYSLDLKSFQTKTGGVTLNVANFDLGNGKKLLEELDHEISIEKTIVFKISELS